MLQESDQINGNGVTDKSTTLQQVEWLDEAIEYLQKFKKQVSEGTITLDSGYFDKSSNMPEREVLRQRELRLSVDYNEAK